MSLEKDKIEKIVFSVIDEYNAFHSEQQHLEKNTDAVLFSRPGFTKQGKLDSIGLINLLVMLEEKMKTGLGDTFKLNIELLIQEKESKLKNISSLIDHLMALAKEN
jgi:acyl carrier protein